MSNDELIAFVVAVAALSLAWRRRHRLLTALGQWLQHYRITLPGGDHLATIPYLGGLDLPRILAAGATTGLLTLGVCWLLCARGRAARPSTRRRGGGDFADADELG